MGFSVLLLRSEGWRRRCPFNFLTFVLVVGVWPMGVESLLTATGGGDLDAALPATSISAVSFGGTVAPPAASLGLLPFPLIAYEGEQREHDVICFRLQ